MIEQYPNPKPSGPMNWSAAGHGDFSLPLQQKCRFQTAPAADYKLTDMASANTERVYDSDWRIFSG
jgi:hypothetical protein